MANKKRLEKHVSAKRTLLTSFLVDLLDVVLSFGVAILSGSVIMFTQVLEGVSDLSSSGLLLIGLNRSMQKEDRKHPFGYGREIYFWTLLAALTMFGITSTLSFYFGYQRFIHPEPIHSIHLTLLILLITLFTNGYAFIVSCKRLLRNRSFASILRIFYRSSLVETKATFILDLMGTLASFLGLIALLIYDLGGDPRLDGLGAMVIGVSLGILAIFLVLGIKDMLVGRSASPETEEQIRVAALSLDEVRRVTGVKTLYIGPEKLLVSLDISMEQKLQTKELEKLIDRIEEKIRVVVPSANYVLVELES